MTGSTIITGLLFLVFFSCIFAKAIVLTIYKKHNEDMKRTKNYVPAVTNTVPQWNIKRIKQAHKLALLGLNDPDIAKEMEISLGTLQYWKRTKPEFYEALKEGKTSADAKVVSALYKNAIGYEYDDIVVNNNKIREFNEFGVVTREYYKTEIVPVKKKVLPDTKSQIKWLQARQPEKWGDTRSVNVKNQLNISIQNNAIDFSEITDSELALLKKLGLMTGNKPLEIEGEYESEQE